MDLREGEQVLKVFHHHPTPFIVSVIKVILSFSPFFLLLFVFMRGVEEKYFLLSLLVVIVLFSLVIIYISLVFWLDKLVITTQRVVMIDWVFLTIRKEFEAMLFDIQEIQTQEKGVLSHFWVLDYGTFILKTASSKVTIEFAEAPDPEGIRQFIYKVRHQ